MIERVIENWLDSSTERSFQKPFCYMLVAEGYTILNLTRHCGIEAGKDILAIAPDGTPCAFQLKSAKNGKISLNQYRSEVQSQLLDLVDGSIIHPSIDPTLKHKSFLVTNGEFEEEVNRSIDDFNRNRTGNQSLSKIRTIVRGELLQKALQLRKGLLTEELKDFKTFLELVLNDGFGVLPKEKLASILESVLPFEFDNKGKAPSSQKCRRAIASAGVICSISISSFTKNGNHSAEIEAWIIYLSYLLGLVEKWNLKPKIWEETFVLTKEIIFNLLIELSDEVLSHENLIEGDPLVDAPDFLRIRVTYLISLVGILAMWLKKGPEKIDDSEMMLERIKKFVEQKKDHLYLWGEAAVPQLLAFYWYYRKIDATPSPDFFIHSLIEAICNPIKRDKESLFANPYYDVEKIIPILTGLTNDSFGESFNEASYFLEGLIHIIVRRNWKQLLKRLWYKISHFGFMQFDVNEKWEYFRWRCEKGVLKTVMCKHRKNWDDLKQEAFESEGESVPEILKSYPILLLLMMIVYPHRMNSSIIRWLDSELLGNR